MSDNNLEESLPELTKAPIPPQTHVLRLDERKAKGKALRDNCITPGAGGLETASRPPRPDGTAGRE